MEMEFNDIIYLSFFVINKKLIVFLPLHGFIAALPVVGLRWFLVVFVSLTKN